MVTRFHPVASMETRWSVRGLSAGARQRADRWDGLQVMGMMPVNSFL